MRIKKDHLYSLLARLNYQSRFRYGLNKDINGWQLYQESVHGGEKHIGYRLTTKEMYYSLATLIEFIEQDKVYQ